MNKKELLDKSFEIMPFVRIALFILWSGTLFFNNWRISVIALFILNQIYIGKRS